MRGVQAAGAVVWLTGLPSSGKSTLARALRAELAGRGHAASVLDGDEVRAALFPKLGYGDADRDAFYATLAHLAAIFAEQGLIAIVAATAHRARYRAEAKKLAPRFVEVLVDASEEACKARDAKGLYAEVARGDAASLPGADLAYERPEAPDVIATGGFDRAAIARVIEALDRAAPGPADSAIGPDAIAEAIGRLEGAPVEVTGIGPIALDRAPEELKRVGYGEPALVVYRVSDEERRAVLHTMGSNWFGHDRRADRAALTLLAADTFDRIPGHVPVMDVGAVMASGSLVSLAGSGELYLLTRWAEGSLYARDLRRIEASGEALPIDVERARALARYLAALHAPPIDEPAERYERAIRDLVGSGEGIFGLADSYPEGGPVARERLLAIESRAVAWRWKLKAKAHRLRRIHGDFHPYNLLFREGTDMTLLDTSRGSMGDPADDIAALTINYVFGKVVYPAAWPKGISPLWRAFFEAYFEARPDPEMGEVIAPFFAWRALVVASPVWYPSLSVAERDALLRFAERLLDEGRFDPRDIASW